jgi:Na+-translocating ferredoxin:NAD+ oxidoreductase subunit D
VAKVMKHVIIGLIPGIATLQYFFGWGVIINILLCATFAYVCEGAMLAARGRPLKKFLDDHSALLTACLLGVALPPLAPWWLSLVAIFFAIVIAKQLFGGLGYNPFNPAMVGYVVALISFPVPMTQWMAPFGIATQSLSLIDTLNVILFHSFPSSITLDAISTATPLDAVKTQLGMSRQLTEIQQAPIFGQIAGVGWEWVNLAFLVGGLWMMAKRLITWHIPVGVLGGLTLLSTIFYMLDIHTHPSPFFHLFSGATMLGAFFIATDPVTAATSPRGRIIYGVGIGLFTYLIRSFGSYPDAIAFATLLMNLAAPTIDYYTKPRVFGHRRG